MKTIVNKEFEFHLLDEEGKAKAQEIAESFDALLTKLLEINPKASREMSICRTKLEEASFYAKKAMAVERVNKKLDEKLGL